MPALTYVTTRTALKALNTANETAVYLTESGREGEFVWKSGDYAARISSDTDEGIYIKANAVAASAGSWVRVEFLSTKYAHAAWFGTGFAGLKKAWALSKRVKCAPGESYTVPAGEQLISEETDVHIDAPQSRFLLTASDAQLCQLRGGWDAEQTVSAASGMTVTVQNGTVYSRGDILKIISDEPLPEFVLIGRKGEFIEVGSVAGNVVTLMRPLYYSYDVQENVRVSRLMKEFAIKVDIGEVVFPINATSTKNAIQIYGAYNPYVSVESAPVLSAFIVRFISTVGGEILLGAIGTAALWSPPSPRVPKGSGLEFHNCEFARARVRYAGGGTRHVVDAGGGDGGDGTDGYDFEQHGASAHNKVYNSLAVGTAAAPFQCHHGVRQMTFEDCTVIGGYGDFFSRGVGVTFRRCISQFPQNISFAAAEQYAENECETDDTRFEDCKVIGGVDRIFELSAGKSTISGGEFELKSDVTASNMIACQGVATALILQSRPKFSISGIVSGRVISINSAQFAKIDLGDAHFSLTQDDNPMYIIQVGGGETPIVRWDGLSVAGKPDALVGIFGSTLPAAGSNFGDARVALGFQSVCAGQTLASVQGYITGVVRDSSLRREYRPQVNSLSLGTVSSGTLTLGPIVKLVHYTNNGPHTLAPPSVDSDIEILITNGSSAGTITTSGWSYVRGNSFTTINTHRFLCRVRRVGTVSILDTLALQ